MAVVKHNSADLDLMARLLRAEAEGEGQQGMLLVGNVGINRIRANFNIFRKNAPSSSLWRARQDREG